MPPRGVTLHGLGVGGMATGTINIPDSTTAPAAFQGVPDGADIIDGFPLLGDAREYAVAFGQHWNLPRLSRSPDSRSEAT